MAVFISMAAGAINVNTLNRGSAIAVGEVSQPGWSLNGKTNFGNGQLFGSNLEANFVTTMFDQDVIDNPIAGFVPANSLQNQSI